MHIVPNLNDQEKKRSKNLVLVSFIYGNSKQILNEKKKTSR